MTLCRLTYDSIYTPVSQKALPSAKTQEMLEIQEYFPVFPKEHCEGKDNFGFFFKKIGSVALAMEPFSCY